MFLKLHLKLKKTLQLLSFISTYLLFSTVSHAIVNMDALHFAKEENSFAADLDFTVSGSSGNSDRTKTSMNGQFTWIAEKSINLAVLGYQYGQSNNVKSVNKSFVHYRYIHQLNSSMDLELFTQLEQNEFTRLSYRGLLGAGLRFSAFNTSNHHSFLGLGAFYSKERIEYIAGLTDDGIEKFTRANLYFLSKYKINSTLSFSNVLYYQPRLNKFSDFRALLESKFDVKISKNLSVRLSFDVLYDSEPSQSIKNTDVSYMSGLKFNF